MTELEFGLEEVGFQPVDGLGGQSSGLQFVGGGTGDDSAGGEDGLVVTQDFAVAGFGMTTDSETSEAKADVLPDAKGLLDDAFGGQNRPRRRRRSSEETEEEATAGSPAIEPRAETSPSGGADADSTDPHYSTEDKTSVGLPDPDAPSTTSVQLTVSRSLPHSGVDHTTYDTTSILATIERSLGLEPLTSRDATVADLRWALLAGNHHTARNSK